MKAENLERIINQGEGISVEFKSSKNRLNKNYICVNKAVTPKTRFIHMLP